MELFHVLNRGVEKRTLFLDSRDYARFVHDMYEFNTTSPAGNAYRIYRAGMMDLVGPSSGEKKREQLVDIHAWCLMKNHYHLLLSERAENGISRFLMKLNVGYAKYFNERYTRDGALFQGRTKKILIENDKQFNYIFHYIHLNPLDYLPVSKDWRIRSHGSIQNAKKAMTYLKTYRWSSYLDYVGEKNFPSLLAKDVRKTTGKTYNDSLTQYLKDAETAQLPLSSLQLE